MAYADHEDLALILRVDADQREDDLNSVLDSAAEEIDAELADASTDSGLAFDPDNPPALVVEVNLERAAEHWKQRESPFGLIGLGGMETPAFAASDTWTRHAAKLAPLKAEWGIA